jgi:hypothetical protein
LIPTQRGMGSVGLAPPIRCEGQRELAAQRRQGTTSRRSTSSPTASSKTMDNLKEAGQRIRATQSLRRSEGMTDGENHRDLLTCLSAALAMTEAAYLEARRRSDL